MKNRMIASIAALAFAGAAGAANAQPVVDTVMTGCKAEIENYCSQVTLGEGRLLACFYAHEDKLSGQCQYALYTAANQLDQAVNALQYVASECQGDIETFCASVQAGEGRIAECLAQNADVLSDGCSTAIEEVSQ